MISPKLTLSQRGRQRTESSDSDTQDGNQVQGSFDVDSHKDITEASFLFAIVGIGYLFPFSALTQPVDYWKVLFPDFNIEFEMTTIYMYTNLAVLAFLVFCMGENTLSFSRNIVGGFVGQLFVLIFVPTSYFAHLNEQGNKIVVLGATAFAAAVTAFIDSSIIGLAARYPVRVQEAFQLGVGISTLIGSIYRDATKAVFSANQTVESSLLYFYSGAATIGICILAYFRLLQLDLSKLCLSSIGSPTKNLSKGNVSEWSPLLSSTRVPTTNDTSGQKPDRLSVLRKILPSELVICGLFASTLALWPPLVTEIPSFSLLPHNDWWSLGLLTLFSLMDCTGRLLVRYRSGLTKSNIGKVVLLRALIFPPLMTMSVQGVFQSDVLSLILVGALGFSNGYVGTISIIMVNESCNEEEQSIAGTFTGFFLNSGLVVGATLGLCFEQLIS